MAHVWCISVWKRAGEEETSWRIRLIPLKRALFGHLDRNAPKTWGYLHIPLIALLPVSRMSSASFMDLVHAAPLGCSLVFWLQQHHKWTKQISVADYGFTLVCQPGLLKKNDIPIQRNCTVNYGRREQFSDLVPFVFDISAISFWSKSS